MSVSLIRLLIGDRTKVAVNENVGTADGANKEFQLDMFPLASAPSAVLTILSTGVVVVTANYTISGAFGRITFGSAPTAGNAILASYKYHSLTSGEISDVQSGTPGKPYLAAANCALILAADDSKLFAYTMGGKEVDKRGVAKSLRDLSAALENRHYTMKNKENFTATVFTFKDNSNTVYAGYDSAVAYLPTGTG